ncbi:MAG: PDZ domain-containing protein, partial [Myxococcota bacterium]
WIKAYRPDENSANSAVSYYTKGALLGWNLDARIRAATGGRVSLDDVMRRAYLRYSGSSGYQRRDFIKLVEQMTGKETARWLDIEAASPRALRFDATLAWFGLRFKPRASLPAADTPADRAARRKKAWLGVRTRLDKGRHIVTGVVRGSPAYDAGINVDDELVGLGGFRIIDVAKAAQRYEPGASLPLLLARRGALRTIDVKIGERPRKEWTVEVDPDAGQSARRHRQRWLRFER